MVVSCKKICFDAHAKLGAALFLALQTLSEELSVNYPPLKGELEVTGLKGSG